MSSSWQLQLPVTSLYIRSNIQSIYYLVMTSRIPQTCNSLLINSTARILKCYEYNIQDKIIYLEFGSKFLVVHLTFSKIFVRISDILILIFRRIIFIFFIVILRCGLVSFRLNKCNLFSLNDIFYFLRVW